MRVRAGRRAVLAVATTLAGASVVAAQVCIEDHGVAPVGEADEAAGVVVGSELFPDGSGWGFEFPVAQAAATKSRSVQVVPRSLFGGTR